MNTSSPLRATSTCLIALAATLAAGTPALATPPSVPGTVVLFSDLDLTKPTDAGVLYDRIRRAARLVCVDATTPASGRHFSELQVCIEQAVEDAVRTVNRPTLTALHRAKTGAATILGAKGH